MKLFVNSLILEVTRRCNMHCEHCLRGEAQNMDIDNEVIDAVAQHIEAGSITFTGGEPSLNVKAIQRYFDVAERHNNFPGSFFVATNGKDNQEELAVTLLRAYAKCYDKDMCAVHISSDIFHDTIDRDNNIITGLAFYNPQGHVHPRSESSPAWVIDEGRANEYGWGMREGIELERHFENIIEDINGDTIYVDELYVSANGLCVSDCDASYENIDEHPLCHIASLPDILRQIGLHGNTTKGVA